MYVKTRKTTSFLIAAVLAIGFVMPLATVGAVPNGTVPPGSPNPSDPPLNSVAYAAISGNLGYAAGGAAMRNQGYGNITLHWTGSVVKAYLIWGIINTDSASLTGGKINGHSITGTYQATDFSPCWGNGNLTIFAADVTPYVLNGLNNLAGFASGLTTGADPWGASVIAPLTEGASLVVVHDGSTPHQVYVYTGAYTSFGGVLTTTFLHGTANAITAQTSYMVADGQLPGNFAQWNGVTVDSNAFPGNDNHTSAATWSFGSLWDTKTYSVPITNNTTSQTASVASSGSDCITWAGQVISIPSVVPIITHGVPQFGMSSLMVAAVGVLLVTALLKRKSSIQITS